MIGWGTSQRLDSYRDSYQRGNPRIIRPGTNTVEAAIATKHLLDGLRRTAYLRTTNQKVRIATSGCGKESEPGIGTLDSDAAITVPTEVFGNPD
jgi:hypothetical protein